MIVGDAVATMDEPSEQLHLETRDAVVRALATRRPILHHLNADTSWLLQIPRPANAVKHGSRVYYNVLIDPWFVGGQSDVAKWFSQQWHATPSAVQSIAEVEELVRQVELLAGGMRRGSKRRAGADDESLVDAVAISHEFTDHCHKETLLEVHRDVPVFATEVCTTLLHTTHVLTPLLGSIQAHILLVTLPHRHHHPDFHRRQRLARLFPLASPVLAQHLTPHRRWRLSILPLCAPHHIRNTPLPIHHTAQTALLPQHKRRRPGRELLLR
jgi:hypothetical protein